MDPNNSVIKRLRCTCSNGRLKVLLQIRGSNHIFSLFHHKNVCCGYSLEELWQGASNEYHNVGYCVELKIKAHLIQSYVKIKERLPKIPLCKFCRTIIPIFYDKIQPLRFLGSVEDFFFLNLRYTGMALY